MKNQRPKCTVIKRVANMVQPLLCAVLLLAGGAASAAQVVGVVAHLSGPLLDRKADGSVKVLGLKSEVENGDTLVSEKNTYAQIRFVDNHEITLQPGTTFRIENFSYDAGKPDADSAAFSLVKGGLRSITGLLGKRNKERFSLKTPSATIGIRGTTFVVTYVAPEAGPANPLDTLRDSLGGLLRDGDPSTAATGKVARGADGPAAPDGTPGKLPNQGKLPTAPTQPVLPPGLHLQVTDGAIVVTNKGGSLGFQAGQFGYVPSVNQPPVMVPPNQGLQFVPPPAFSGATPAGPATAGGSSPDKSAVDCIVR